MIVHDLGTLLLEVGEGVFPVGGKKPAAILAALLIGVNQRVPVESLIDAASGEQASPKAGRWNIGVSGRAALPSPAIGKTASRRFIR